MDGEDQGERAPGDHRHGSASPTEGLTGYLTGLALAGALTVASFAIPGTGWVWQPAVPYALAALAMAQMGVHLVFFLHLSTGADNINNTLALAFGVLIVALLVGGSLWIMAHLDSNMMTAAQMAAMQR